MEDWGRKTGRSVTANLANRSAGLRWGGQKRPNSISLRSAKWLRDPVPRRNLDEFRLPALRTGQLALSWQASA